MFLFGSYKLWFLFGIWESLLHLLGPVAPVRCNLPEAFGVLHMVTLVASPSFPASCTVRQRVVIPASGSSPEFSRLHISVSTVEPSSRSFSLAVPRLLGFDFGALHAVSPAHFGASPFSFDFCLCLACTVNWKPFVLFFSEMRFSEISYPSTCRATLTASWGPFMLPTWQ